MANEEGTGHGLESDEAALAAAFAPGTEELRAAVAERLRRSVDEVVLAVRRATQGGEEGSASVSDRRAARQQITATVRCCAEVLAECIGSGERPSSERLAALGEAGRRMAGVPVPLAQVVQVHCRGRDELATLVRLECRRRRATPQQALGLLVAVGRGVETTLFLVARAYDERIAMLSRELDAKQREMTYRALHDPLTGVANRALLFDRLHQVAQRARRRPTTARPALLFIDLDGFKAVNDERGHAAGDAVLRLLARRLSGAVRPEDTVARLDGDEFVVLCEAIPDRGWVLQLAGRLLGAVQAPIVEGDRSTVIGASIGIAVGDWPGWDADRLLSEADHAMFRAKQQGPGRVHAPWLAERSPGPPRPAS